MSLLLQCPTNYAVLLLGCVSDDLPMRFPNGTGSSPGYVFKVDPGVGLNEQFVKVVSTELEMKVNPRDFNVEQAFHTPVTTSDGEAATLYVATLIVSDPARAEKWATMPEVLRQMPKNRNRLAYVKAWQVLAGALSEKTKAVDIADLFPDETP